MEAVAAVAGFGAAAVTLANGACEKEGDEQRRLIDRVLAAVPGIGGLRVYGDPVDRLPHLVCLGVDGVEPQAVLLGLDRAGVAAHSGSACASEGLEPSPVLEAMGVDAAPQPAHLGGLVDHRQRHRRPPRRPARSARRSARPRALGSRLTGTTLRRQ